MINNILVGTVLILITVTIHSLATKVVITLVLNHTKPSRKHRRGKLLLLINGVVLVMIFASILESSLWAYTYLIVDALSHLEEALYFSLVTYTTLGYGEIVLGQDWRLLSAFEAANGIIIFGWTTAVLIAVIQRIYFIRNEK